SHQFSIQPLICHAPARKTMAKNAANCYVVQQQLKGAMFMATAPSRRNVSTVTRRRFVKNAALTGVSLMGFPAILRSRSSERLNIVIIGCGGRGGANMNQMVRENIVAICDVSEQSLAKAGEKAPNAKRFRDYRKLYDELKDSEFDAVVVSTTEHTHAFAT